MLATMARYEMIDGTSRKFWEIRLKGKTFEVRFGRIGTEGQSQTKSFSSPAQARAAHDKLVEEKTKKGYRVVGSKDARTGSKGTPAGSAPRTRGRSKAGDAGLAEKLVPAIVEGSVEAVKRLLDAGADPNVKSAKGAAPLLNAVLFNRTKIFELLVAYGAKPRVLHGKFNLLLTLASRKGKGLRFVHRLVELGVDPNFVGDDTTPILHAVRTGNLRFVEVLLEIPSLDTRSVHYERAIAWARNTRQAAVAKKLLQRQDAPADYP